MAKAWQQICKQLGIQQHLSTGYHPKTDRQTERANQEVKAYLRLFAKTIGVNGALSWNSVTTIKFIP